MYDRYGGYMSIRGNPTGFFHTEKIDGRWFIITPEGNAFFSKGVCHISFTADIDSELGYSVHERHNIARYGSREKWANHTVEMLKELGFNTAGAWSDPDIGKSGIAYTPVLHLAETADPDLFINGNFPDVFSRRFLENIDALAKEKCSPVSDDPYLLGYFTDNELRWGPDWRSDESILETYLNLDEGSDGRRRAIEFLDSRNSNPNDLTDDDKKEFQRIASREYFSICHDAIRRYDKNHMILGCRFAGSFLGDTYEVISESMKPFVDIVSLNHYGEEPPVGTVRNITRLTGKPVIVSEFSFRSKESGLPNTKGASPLVGTHKQRADMYEAFVTMLFSTPECVGYHWFEYCDQPSGGRLVPPDGENSNYGIVREDGSVYESLADRMRDVNSRLESIAIA